MGNTSSQHVLAIKSGVPSNKQGLIAKGNRKICLNTRSCVFIYDKRCNEDIQLQLKKLVVRMTEKDQQFSATWLWQT
jgi:hypothetical protein